MIVPVFGMHRSGTSALAGLLHNNGIVMGRDKEFYPPPMKENPKGFYENVRFRRLNDAILHACNYRVKSFRHTLPKVRVVPQAVLEKMHTLVQGYHQQYPEWGWKDPRTCLNAAAWLHVLADQGLLKQVYPIVIFREPKDVRDSMLRRGNKESTGSQFVKLAEMYNDALFKSLALFNQIHNGGLRQPFFVTFDQLVFHAEETCEKLSAYLGRPIENNGHVDPQIAAKVA